MAGLHGLRSLLSFLLSPRRSEPDHMRLVRPALRAPSVCPWCGKHTGRSAGYIGSLSAGYAPRGDLWLRETVSTGVVPDALVAAAVTLLHMTAESGRSADLDRIHDAALGTGQRGVVVISVGVPVAAEDVRHFWPPACHRPAA